MTAADKWRENYNPTRGLTLAAAAEMADRYTSGRYADLMWLLAAPFSGVEAVYADLQTIITRRAAALQQIEWRVDTVPEDQRGYDETLAQEQAEALRAMYEGIDGLYGVIEGMLMAQFRGFALAEKLRDFSGAIVGLNVVDPWNVARRGLRGDWYYNPHGYDVSGEHLGDDLRCDPADWLISTCTRPVHAVALPTYVLSGLGVKDWASFVEIYGLPGGVVIGPSNVPQGQEGRYESSAEGIAKGGSGYLPFGSTYVANGYPSGTAPFAEWLGWLQKQVVLVGTGGLLTVINGATGLGSGQSAAHSDAFDSLARRDARGISELFNRSMDAELLNALFPGRPRLAYWTLAPEDAPGQSEVLDAILKLSQAGYRVETPKVTELVGYPVVDAPQAQPALQALPGPQDLAANSAPVAKGPNAWDEIKKRVDEIEAAPDPAASRRLAAALLEDWPMLVAKIDTVSREEAAALEQLLREQMDAGEQAAETEAKP